jgi:methylenetetrahydrofolate dehydrogenase (NADP+)/methenyltetrahydrofolate cyclohydrolase
MVRRGVVVVDVGINVVDGAIVGDVDFESVRRLASAITPVPGGVGPLTNALLLAHLVRAARGQEAVIVSPVEPADTPPPAPATVVRDRAVASRGVR